MRRAGPASQALAEGFRKTWGKLGRQPVAEVDLCGHATLATAHVLFERLTPDRTAVRFRTLSGELTVTSRSTSICTPPGRR